MWSPDWWPYTPCLRLCGLPAKTASGKAVVTRAPTWVHCHPPESIRVLWGPNWWAKEETVKTKALHGLVVFILTALLLPFPSHQNTTLAFIYYLEQKVGGHSQGPLESCRLPVYFHYFSRNTVGEVSEIPGIPEWMKFSQKDYTDLFMSQVALSTQILSPKVIDNSESFMIVVLEIRISKYMVTCAFEIALKES